MLKLTIICSFIFQVGEPCKKRKYEFENRQMALDQYGLSIQLGRKMVDMFKGGDEKYNHLDKEEVAKVEKAIQEHSTWMDKNLNALATQKKWEDPAVTISQVNQTVEMKCRDAMSFGGKLLQC